MLSTVNDMHCFSLLLIALLLPSAAFARVLPTFADIVDRAKPGVVNIRTTTVVRHKEPRLDPYQFFLKERLPTISSSQSLGSGVIVDRQGHILTNFHVIQDATKIEVLFANMKKKITAEVVGSDPKTDLALLKVVLPAGLHPADLGDSESLRVGDIVLAIGNPFGYAHTVTSGIISATGRVIGTGPYDNFLQTDAPIHPGNSGGPLIDIRGRVIGINSAVDSDAHGIGFALPINLAKRVMQDLLKHGQVVRPFLGVVGRNILSADEVGDKFDPVGVYGVLVSNLVVEGPAHLQGVKMGDLIMGIEQQKVTDLNLLQRKLGDYKPKDKIKIRFYRRGQGYFEKVITLGVTPKAEDLPKEKDLF
jgi:S1-C subfamily serine protease